MVVSTFIILTDCKVSKILYRLSLHKGWLSKEDFDHLTKAASAMAYRFDGMMKQVTDCINEIETIHRGVSFEIDVNDKEAEFLTEYKIMLENIRRTKEGENLFLPCSSQPSVKQQDCSRELRHVQKKAYFIKADQIQSCNDVIFMLKRSTIHI